MLVEFQRDRDLFLNRAFKPRSELSRCIKQGVKSKYLVRFI